MKADSPIKFPSGKSMKNRFMLAPMTNTQSNDDGTLSDQEFFWLVKRAEGGFGLVCTCASHVSKLGQGFPGQLGIYNDEQIAGHTRLAKAIQEYGSLAIIQLHHAGMRSPKQLIGEAPLCPSNDEKTGARAMSLAEVKELRDDFIQAAIRSQKAGYDGVEIHGAHGYILGQFLSAEINFREDEYGGSFENRARLIKEIAMGIRKACGEEFVLGLRLSPERFGMQIDEIKELCLYFEESKLLDFLDISLWDCFKMPEDEKFQNKSLLEHFTNLGLTHTKLTVAGKISSSENVRSLLDNGVDFVSIGKSGILHYNFPELVLADPDFQSQETPVSKAYLHEQGLGDKFISYMSKWPGFVED